MFARIQRALSPHEIEPRYSNVHYDICARVTPDPKSTITHLYQQSASHSMTSDWSLCIMAQLVLSAPQQGYIMKIHTMRKSTADVRAGGKGGACCIGSQMEVSCQTLEQ